MDINREGENGTIKRQEIEGKEKEMMHGTKAWGIILQVCQGNSTLMKYLIQLPTIGRICYKENHRVNFLGLNGSKIHAIYLVELQKIYEMMA